MADFDTAEQRVRATGRPLLIFYKDTRPGVDEAIRQALDGPGIKRYTEDRVRCTLFRPYEPDRRYVAQFGVERAPALIVVHRDGTYHARAGIMTPEEISRFLAEAKPPGAQPRLNPHIPRRPDYTWHKTLASARMAARLAGQPMLIVFERRFSRDWHKLKKLLHRREVYSRFADMVHCRISLPTFSAEAYITQFGALELPAIVIAGRNGSYRVLELPTSYEAIVRFADGAREPDAASGSESMTYRSHGR